jgi:hypothetical protein
MSGRRPLFSGGRRGKHWRLLALAQQLDAETVRQVFTHSSWVSERGRSYERLEFLGDSVLSLAVTTDLYRRFRAQRGTGAAARLRRPADLLVARRPASTVSCGRSGSTDATGSISS